MTVKERPHKIVDEMSDEEAATTLEHLAARRSDPLARLLDAAPQDDEPLTPEEADAIQQGTVGRRVAFDGVAQTLRKPPNGPNLGPS